MDFWKYANPQLCDLVAYDPGRPIEEVARDLGLDPRDIIKLASNENPIGPSPKAVAAMKSALDLAHFYPDGGGYHLRGAIAQKWKLQRENVVLGNGSNEIIELIGHCFLQPGDSIVVSQHAFVVYRLMAQLFGAETITVPDPDFRHDLDAMVAAITPQTKQVYIANPNNPTGTLVGQEEIDRFMDKVPDHVVVVFDEAYYEFLDAAPDTLKYVREGRPVVVMRTFSKAQGLAALRIGYGLAPAGLAEILQKARQPFNANAIAQAGALASFADEAHQVETKRVVDAGRQRLESAFAQWELEYVPSVANFVLVRVGDGKAVFEALLHKGVIVRDMAAYQLPEWIRVTVGTSEQNERFLKELAAQLSL